MTLFKAANDTEFVVMMFKVSHFSKGVDWLHLTQNKVLDYLSDHWLIKMGSVA